MVEKEQNSRNAPNIEPCVREESRSLLRVQWSMGQIAEKLHTLYQHFYEDKTVDGVFCKDLHCQNQKRKRYAGWQDQRRQITNSRPSSERKLHIKTGTQIVNWHYYTVISAKHKEEIAAIVERNSGYVVIAKVPNKISVMVSSAIIRNYKPLNITVKTMTYENGKEFAAHGWIQQQLNGTIYFRRAFAS